MYSATSSLWPAKSFVSITALANPLTAVYLIRERGGEGREKDEQKEMAN